VLVSNYPVGTSLLMTPFVFGAGYRGAFVSSMLCLLIGILVTARWLQEERRSPLFALLVLGFPAALVLGRVAMSDVPSFAVVALGLWLFWRGLDRGARWWLASGFVAGLSLLFREANALPFIPFFAGAVIRRERKACALVAGGCAGVALRLLSSYLVHGDPFYFKPTSAVWGRHSLLETLSVQLLGLLVFVPGGLVAAMLYRGRRRPELLASVALFVGFYVSYRYSAAESGPARQLVLGLRFFVPLLPLLAFAMGESVPRLWQRLLAKLPDRRRPGLERLAGVALVVWLFGVASAAAVVHPVFDRWSGHQAEIRDEIHRLVREDAVLITNIPATKKFIPWLAPNYLPLNRATLPIEHANTLALYHREFFVVLLDRTDSATWREDARANAAFVAGLEPRPTLLLDREVTRTDRLRIWRVSGRQRSRS
jgi:4-amino-4-deoxy-L-arabinose transferase-like glycosyltransferase